MSNEEEPLFEIEVTEDEKVQLSRLVREEIERVVYGQRREGKKLKLLRGLKQKLKEEGED